MKKFVGFSVVLMCSVPLIFLCSCTKNTSGFVYELTSAKWSAELSGGAEITLSFSDEIADLQIKSFDKTADICGKYTADEESFIIFDDELSQIYTFYYTVRGENLDLTYDGDTVTLKSF